ncbi:MAG: hypothetical protein MI749_18345 [Desulfovibrionales bacterium]|nr:hypothetical protein [Desulfovibrionales bacterium]
MNSTLEKRGQDLKDFFNGNFDTLFKKISPTSVAELKQRILSGDLTVPESPEDAEPKEQDDLRLKFLMQAYRLTLLYIESATYYNEHGSPEQRKIFEEAMLHKLKQLPTRNI